MSYLCGLWRFANAYININNEGGIENALNDSKGRGRKAEITDADITWVINKARQKPKDYGYSAELWYPASFTRFIHSIAEEDRLPVPGTGKANPVRRNYEYVRFGTLSLLAAIDLLTREAVPLVSPTHKSYDFIRFLKMLDEKYPAGDKIRLILNNHSAHTSQGTIKRPRNI